jgi:hypothetical protein
MEAEPVTRINHHRYSESGRRPARMLARPGH